MSGRSSAAHALVLRLSLRARLTLVATAALAAGLAAGATLLVFVTHRAALSTVDETARRHNTDLRTGALILGVGRVEEATRIRGLFP